MSITASDVVLWYDVDEGSGTALDNKEGTASRDGTASGTTWVTGGPTNLPDALDFVPGGNDYVTINNTLSELIASAAGDFSFLLCIKHDTTPNGSYLVNDWGSSPNRSLLWRVMSDADMEVYVSDGGTASELQLDYTTGVSTTDYEFYVLTRSGNTTTLYLNGAQVATNTGSFSLPTSTSDVHFGLNPGHNDVNWDGKLAQLIMLNRTIDATEAASVSNSGDGITYEQFFGGATQYTLTADTASFALNGSQAGLTLARTLSATTGSFTLSGQAVALTRALRMAAEAATFTLTGNDAELSTGKRLLASPGTFTLTGSDATLTRSVTMIAETGSFTFTGQGAELKRAIVMQTEAAVFTLTGVAITFNFPDVYTMTAETAVFTLTGIPPSMQVVPYTAPGWTYEIVPGGGWLAGQAGMTAGAEMFDGLTVYAGQLGEASVWDTETLLDEEDTPSPSWAYEAVPGGSWEAGQPALTAGAELFDGLQVYAGQLGETSSWELEVQ